jgi:serine/threonine protein kinase
MDDPKRTHNAGLEDERAFTETLVTDHGVDGKQGPVSEVNDTGLLSAGAKSVTKQPSWVGKIMGHFKLLRLIGEGAMGLVIQAQDTNLKRIVALKVLRKQLSAGEKGKDFVEQFLREARAAASIEHPNIVRVYEINQHAGWWYIAMEMVSGNSLQEIIKAAGALPASRACPIIADAAIALQVAHELGMIHRDIKPSNILVTRNGHGKVSDFGLVRVDDPNDPFDAYARQSIGTPFYMAPEIIRRETISPAVDIYSLGATLYYILTGRPPYTAENIKDVLKQHLYADPPDLRHYLPGCSPNLASLIQRMMAKEPGARPAAAEVAAILHAESIVFLSDVPGSAGSGGSTAEMEWQGILQKTRISASGQTVHALGGALSKFLGLLPVKVRTVWQVFFAAMILIVFGGLAVYLYRNRNVGQDRLAVSGLFPQAPAGYGTRNAFDFDGYPRFLMEG